MSSAAIRCPEGIRFDVNGVCLTATTERRVPRLTRRSALALAAVAALAILLVPKLALAGVIEDFFGGFLSGWIEDQLNQTVGMFEEIGNYGIITSSFDTILGTGAVSIATLAENVAQYTIFPVACVVFSLAVMMQLLKVAQRMDQTGQIPAIKEVVFLFLWVAICIYVIGHSFGLVRDLYSIVLGFINSISPGELPKLNFDPQLDGILESIGLMFGLGVTGLILHVAALLVAVTSNVMFLARGVQIYLYAMFAPLTLSFLGFDELRPWAVGYVKGLLSVLISGFIMMFAVAAFPYLLTGMLSSSATVTRDMITIVVDGGANSTWVVGILAACFGLFTILVKSGSFAREIMGG